jgi:hypothetical protein
MILIIAVVTLIFIFYYLASFNSSRLDHRVVFIIGFLIFTIFLRIDISPELNKDYYGYYDLHNFENPTDITSFLLSEPYLYLIYKFFEFFTTDKKYIFIGIYWFNFSITNFFFIWLATRMDVVIWKKMLLFVFYYFLFGFVLLRNGPVYIFYAYFFYYSYRNKKFKKIVLTPFMHLSALALMITLFQRNKYYFKFFFSILLFLLPVLIFILMPILTDIIALQGSMNKVDSYSEGIEVVSIFHKIYLLFVTMVILVTFIVYKKQAINPILITTIVFYYIFFFINPVLGFRFSPYVFMAILLFNFDGITNAQIWVKILNILSFLLLPYFLFTLFDTHSL